MKMNPSQDKEKVYLPRSEKHYHIVVNEEMHFALRQYATKYGLSLASAAARLIRQGLIYELSKMNAAENRASLRQLVTELAKMELKKRKNNV